MATQLQSVSPKLSPYRINVRQFEKMIDAGVFPEGVRLELIAGVLVEMTINEPHSFAVGTLGDLIRPFVPEGYHLREEKPSRTARYWRPEPDIAIVRGVRRDYTQETPNLDRFALIIEVADTSYAKDRSWKWRRYAASGVPYYGILDLNKRRLEVFTQPTDRGKAARYEALTVYGPEDEAPVVVDGVEVGRFRVAEVLP